MPKGIRNNNNTLDSLTKRTRNLGISSNEKRKIQKTREEYKNRMIARKNAIALAEIERQMKHLGIESNVDKIERMKEILKQEYDKIERMKAKRLRLHGHSTSTEVDKCVNRKKPCPPEKICNPVSGRCVKKTGKLGKELLAKSRSKRRSVKRSVREYAIHIQSYETNQKKQIFVKGTMKSLKDKVKKEFNTTNTLLFKHKKVTSENLKAVLEEAEKGIPICIVPNNVKMKKKSRSKSRSKSKSKSKSKSRSKSRSKSVRKSKSRRSKSVKKSKSRRSKSVRKRRSKSVRKSKSRRSKSVNRSNKRKSGFDWSKLENNCCKKENIFDRKKLLRKTQEVLNTNMARKIQNFAKVQDYANVQVDIEKKKKKKSEVYKEITGRCENFDQMVKEFQGKGGTVIWVPEDLSGTNFGIGIEEGDVLVPVCHVGQNRSQVMLALLCGIKQIMGGKVTVLSAHGAETGFDPHQAYENLNDENFWGYNCGYHAVREEKRMQRLKEGEKDHADELDDRQKEAIGIKKCKRIGHDEADGKELNPTNFDRGQWMRLERDRKHMRNWFNKNFYSMKTDSDHKRIFIFAFLRAGPIMIRRFLDQNRKSLKGIHIVLVPLGDPIPRSGGSDKVDAEIRKGDTRDRDTISKDLTRKAISRLFEDYSKMVFIKR